MQHYLAILEFIDFTIVTVGTLSSPGYSCFTEFPESMALCMSTSFFVSLCFLFIPFSYLFVKGTKKVKDSLNRVCFCILDILLASKKLRI